MFAARSANAQDAASDVPVIEPDRPDVTNGTHIVENGLLQIEMGGLFTRDAPGQTSSGTPFTARLGVADWLEVRIGGDGWLWQSNGAAQASGIGNVQLGAKLRLWDSPGGVPVLSILPQINMPTANADKDLGSGAADYLLGILTGTDIGARGHVDVNYGIGAIGAGGGLPHFVQHEASVSASATVRAKWNPYFEIFWFSRDEANGTASTSIDGGAIYEVSPRLALDGGVQRGLSRAAPDLAAFGGVSVVVGEILGGHGVHGRQRRPPKRTARPRQR